MLRRAHSARSPAMTRETLAANMFAANLRSRARKLFMTRGIPWSRPEHTLGFETLPLSRTGASLSMFCAG